MNAVLLVVDLVRLIGINDLDDIAISNQAIVLFVDPERAQKSPVHRIAPQQAGAFDEIVVRGLAYDDGFEAQLVAAPGLLDEQSRDQSTDAPETEQHYILWFLERWHVSADDLRALVFDELEGRDAVFFTLRHIARRQLADIDMRWTQIQLRQGLENRITLKFRKLVVRNLTHVAVSLHDLHDALQVERAAVAVGHHIAAVETADDGNHRLS